MAKSDKDDPACIITHIYARLKVKEERLKHMSADLRDSRIRIAELECQLKLAEAAVMQAKLDRAEAILLTDPSKN